MTLQQYFEYLEGGLKINDCLFLRHGYWLYVHHNLIDQYCFWNSMGTMASYHNYTWIELADSPHKQAHFEYVLHPL